MCSIHCVGPCYPSIYSMRMSEFNLQQMIKKVRRRLRNRCGARHTAGGPTRVSSFTIITSTPWLILLLRITWAHNVIVTAAVSPNAHKLFEKEPHSTRGAFQMTPLLLFHALPKEFQLGQAARARVCPSARVCVWDNPSWSPARNYQHTSS